MASMAAHRDDAAPPQVAPGAAAAPALPVSRSMSGSQDAGYFGPDSVTWAVVGQPLVIVGGLRALLLQALHPAAMAVMDARTVFRDEPFARIRRTADYVEAVTFGSRAEADAASARVRSLHARLGIDDPTQLAWVHACEVDSFLVAAVRAGVRIGGQPLAGELADAFVAEQRRGGSLVGVPDALMPATVAELAEYFEQQRPGLRLTREAVRGVRYVIAPPMSLRTQLLTPARLTWSTLSALSIGLLPRWARRLYGLPATAAGDLAVTAGLRATRAAVESLPQRVRLRAAGRDSRPGSPRAA
jgi:uncharacterized protein (DUF2236 family)